MTLLWWHWLVLGLLLVLVEMASAGGFYFIFFGIAALALGAAGGLGIEGPLWLQVFLFSVLSVGSLVLFRSRLLRAMQLSPQAPAVDALVGEIGTATAALLPGDIGKIELRGSAWTARNVSDAVLPPGGRCRVAGIDGLTVNVVPEGARS